MDFPQRGNDANDGNDGPGRPPRKAAQEGAIDDDQNNVVDAFGDRSDLPLLLFLFFAAMLAEHFRNYFVCGC